MMKRSRSNNLDDIADTDDAASEVSGNYVGPYGRINWSEGAKLQLYDWVATCPPSKYGPLDCSWISVENVDKDSPGYDDCRSGAARFDTDSYQSTLSQLTTIIDSGRRIMKKTKQTCVNEILDIATDALLTVGKWILFIPPDKADKTWAIIAKSTALGELGRYVRRRICLSKKQ
jgi:Domain of unknown function (DUF1917)